jgi:hypothetical protein
MMKERNTDTNTSQEAKMTTRTFDDMMTPESKADRKARRDARSLERWSKAEARQVIITDQMIDVLEYLMEDWCSQTNVIAAHFGIKTQQASTLLNTMERWGLCTHLSMNSGTKRATRLWSIAYAGRSLIS